MPDAPLLAWIWKEPQFEAASSIPLSDRGFRYGMSVFESLRLHNGTLQFAAEHWTRLEHSTRKCGFALPDAAFATIEPTLRELHGDWFIRLYVTAGDGAPSSPITNSRLILLAEERLWVPGNSLRLLIHAQTYLAPLGGLKTANYWANVNAFRQARQADAMESLLFNPAGHLVSAAMANTFLKLDGRWITPSLQTGARDGVIRGWVMSRLQVEERLISKAEVLRAESLFLTNSWMGLQPAAQLESRPLEQCPTASSLHRELQNAEH